MENNTPESWEHMIIESEEKRVEDVPLTKPLTIPELISKWSTVLNVSGSNTNVKSILIEPFTTSGSVRIKDLMDKWEPVTKHAYDINEYDRYILCRQLEELREECKASGNNRDNIFSILLFVLVKLYNQKLNKNIPNISWLYNDFCSTINYDVVMKDLKSYYVLDGMCEIQNMYIDILNERFSK